MQYRNAPAHIRAAINEQAHRWTTTTGEPLTNVLPRYENDCHNCVFVGQYDNNDCYICHGRFMSIVIRHSSRIDDYTSLPWTSPAGWDNPAMVWTVNTYKAATTDREEE